MSMRSRFRVGKRFKIFGVCVGVTLLSWSPDGDAMDPEKYLSYQIGRFVVKPRVVLEETYSNNVFYRSDVEEEDFITVFSPGLTGSLGRPESNNINVSYIPSVVRYMDNDSLNTVNHGIGAGLNWSRSKLTLQGSSDVQMLGGLIGGFRNFVNETTERRVSDHRYSLSYRMTSKLSVAFRGNVSGTDYEESARLLDESLWRTSAGLAYDYKDDVSISGNIFVGGAKAEPNAGMLEGADSDSVGGFIAANGDFTSKLRGEVRLGYESRDLSLPGEVADGVVAGAEVTYEPSNRTQLELDFDRTNGFAVQNARATRTSNRVAFTARQMIGSSRPIWWSSSFSYQNSAFVGAFDGREDKIMVLSSGLTYVAQEWLRFQFRLNYDRFDSSSSGVVDYNQFRVTLGAVIGYQ